jgi:hypothetical protein
VQCLGAHLAGDAIRDVDAQGDPIVGDTIVYLMNAASTPIQYTLPAFVEHGRWECLIDTCDDGREGETFGGGSLYLLGDRSVAVFRLHVAGV